jgi:hypothetical protein
VAASVRILLSAQVCACVFGRVDLRGTDLEMLISSYGDDIFTEENVRACVFVGCILALISVWVGAM